MPRAPPQKHFRQHRCSVENHLGASPEDTLLHGINRSPIKMNVKEISDIIEAGIYLTRLDQGRMLVDEANLDTITQVNRKRERFFQGPGPNLDQCVGDQSS